ncbi:MAG: glycosyltransferase family 9 protein [Chlamydiia bacterium]|nr:glycosyltransferase family 9 protein [Chlamydiia bacterium]
MTRSALLCASGIGDGLLMMIVAHHLKKRGLSPTVFHDSAEALAPLFEEHTFQKHVPPEVLESYDHVIVENDHSKRAWDLFRLRDQGKMQHVRFIFPTASSKFKEGDYLFDPKLPVATNLSAACAFLLGSPPSKENDLTLPEGEHGKFSKRVVIHPTSNDPKRNWKKRQFLELAKRLQKEGYQPVFCVSPSERKDWECLDIDLPSFPSLKELAAYIYESGYLIGNDSGLGHLASNLGITTLTISGNPKRVRLWRPDWALGKVVTLPFPLPNFKGIHFRMRENCWQAFIPVSRVFKAFMELTDEDESCSRLF